MLKMQGTRKKNSLNMNISLMHPRDQLVMMISRIYNSGLTTTSGGNLSVIDESNDIWITPSAVDKGSLKSRDIICLRNSGVLDGPHKPSSELPFHQAIYKSRPDIKAIVHAHPPALVSFSIVRQRPDTKVIPQASRICGPIGYAKYRIPGSEALGKEIAVEFEKGYSAVILENHGIVVGGSDLIDAYQRFEALEFCARILINSRSIGEPCVLTEKEIQDFENQVPGDLPEMKEVSYPSDEKEIRSEICKIVRRACNQGLMMSTYGTASVRWKENNFLITPTNVTRWNISLEDIVQVKNGQVEPGKIPSRSVLLHQEIYARNPEVNSIIFTQPPYLMAYAVTHSHLDVKTIPESWIFLQDVPNVPFGTHFAGNNKIPDLIAGGNVAVIVENDSFLVTGKSLLQAFDRLEVAEFSAKSLTLGKAIGNFYPIGEEEIEALRQKFF